ncbi:MAG TPA: hypothetical protein VGD08_11515 [Stellaceae bacterium]|jgi:hypothetical protein
MSRIFVGALCLVLGACTASPVQTSPVKLRDPATGEIATCGPYPVGLFSQARADETACVGKLERRGYARIPD